MSEEPKQPTTTTAITPWASVTLISLAAIFSGMYRAPCDCGCGNKAATACQCPLTDPKPKPVAPTPSPPPDVGQGIGKAGGQ